MRIENINIMNNGQQQATRSSRLRIGVFLILIGALCSFCVIEVLRTAKSGSNLTGKEAIEKCEKEAYKRSMEAAQGITAVPKGIASSKPSAMPQYKASVNIHHHSHSASYSSSVATPQYAFRSANTGAVTVYTTSSATVKSIGGGGNGGSTGGGSSSVGNIGGGNGGSVSGASIGRNSSTSILVVPTIARISSRELTASNILAAQEQVIKDGVAERQGQPGIRKVNDKPLDPFMDPIGEGVWALLVMLAAYGAFIVYRRKQRV